jgi:hypothetical protein
MTALSAYLETQLSTQIFLTGTFAKPGVLALALTTVLPAATDTGALTGKEVTGAGYTRLSGSGLTNPSNSNWSSTGGITSNVQTLTFPSASADWSTIVGIVITDNATAGAGNALFFGSLSSPKVVSAGDTFQFNTSQLTITLS